MSYLFVYYNLKNLNKKEEKKLFNKAKYDLNIRNNIVESYSKLVLKIAQKIFKYNDESNILFEDIVHEGILGLFKAIEKYDSRYKNGFTAFAIPYIHNSIKSFLRDNNYCFYIPQNKLISASKLKKFINYFYQQHNKYPLMEDMCDFLKCDKDKILDLIHIIEFNNFSHYKENSFVLISEIQKNEEIELIMSEIEKFKSIDKNIFKLRYYEEKSWREIGSILNLSHETVRNKFNDLIQQIQLSISC